MPTGTPCGKHARYSHLVKLRSGPPLVCVLGAAAAPGSAAESPLLYCRRHCQSAEDIYQRRASRIRYRCLVTDAQSLSGEPAPDLLAHLASRLKARPGAIAEFGCAPAQSSTTRILVAGGHFLDCAAQILPVLHRPDRLCYSPPTA